MPSSIRSVMAAAGLEPEGVVRWGELINSDEPGIYIVSTERDVEVVGHRRRPAPIDLSAVQKLLSLRQELTLDGSRPSADELAARLREFWLGDEHILYIGLATDLHNRVNQYYGTPLGARRPHAGGWFLKTLEGLDTMFVHWARTYDRVAAEGAAIGAFVEAVSRETLAQLRDPERPFPFANLEWPAGTRKRHGISGAKAPRVRAAGTESDRERRSTKPRTDSRTAGARPARGGGVMDNSGSTQRVTAADISAGRIRIPRAEKRLFPSQKARLKIVLRGEAIDASWDPRTGPPERSGVIGVGRGRLAGTVARDEVLRVSVGGGTYELE